MRNSNRDVFTWIFGLSLALIVVGFGLHHVRAQRDLFQKSRDIEGSIVFGGRTRTYTLHRPPGAKKKRPLPLVVVLHGGGGNAQNAAMMTEFSEKADAEGFYVVYPNGTGVFQNSLLTWNAHNCCGYGLQNAVDDVGFIRAMIADIGTKYAIDSKRLYATGMSNGGMMSYRLGCEAADLFAAIAPVAGALNTDSCRPANALPIIIFHGTADKNVPYEGGFGQSPFPNAPPREDKSQAFAVETWVTFNGCRKPPTRTQIGNVVRELYTGGRNGAEVDFYTIIGGGHAWPGGNPGFAGADVPTAEISATDVMWEFFKKHPKS